jgi:hypothetical protein
MADIITFLIGIPIFYIMKRFYTKIHVIYSK